MENNKQLLASLNWGEPQLVWGWTSDDLWGLPLDEESDLEPIFLRWREIFASFKEQGLHLILLSGYRSSYLVAPNGEELEEILEICDWSEMPIRDGEYLSQNVKDWLFPFLDRTGGQIWSLGGTFVSLYLPDDLTDLDSIIQQCLDAAPDSEALFPHREALRQALEQSRRIDLWWD